MGCGPLAGLRFVLMSSCSALDIRVGSVDAPAWGWGGPCPAAWPGADPAGHGDAQDLAERSLSACRNAGIYSIDAKRFLVSIAGVIILIYCRDLTRPNAVALCLRCGCKAGVSQPRASSSQQQPKKIIRKCLI